MTHAPAIIILALLIAWLFGHGTAAVCTVAAVFTLILAGCAAYGVWGEAAGVTAADEEEIDDGY